MKSTKPAAYLLTVFSIAGCAAIGWSGFAMLSGQFTFGYFVIAYAILNVALLALVWIIKNCYFVHTSALSGILFLVTFVVISLDAGTISPLEWLGIAIVCAIVFLNWRATNAIVNTSAA